MNIPSIQLREAAIFTAMLMIGSGVFTRSWADPAGPAAPVEGAASAAARPDVPEAATLVGTSADADCVWPSPPKSVEGVAPAAAGAASVRISDDTWLDPLRAAAIVDALTAELGHVRLATPTNFVPSRGPFNLLVFTPFGDPQDSTGTTKPLHYRALIVGGGSRCGNAGSLLAHGHFTQTLLPVSIWPERATRGSSSSPGTDFKSNEPPDGKTLLHLDSNIEWTDSFPLLWQRARIYVIGADDGGARIIGSFDTVVADNRWAAVLSILTCLIAYLIAAIATYNVHQTQRIYDDDGKVRKPSAPEADSAEAAVAPRSLLARLTATFHNRASRHNPGGHGPLIGTNYKTVWAHIFNPVVLTAGPNGLGSATNLQILFFSMIVFGVVAYIWMMTGHLTGLSSTVVLLMGISGVGGTVAAGADLANNRLSFDNWAWLINRDWLPPGGISEVNAAKWKDIFTTNGSFDVYRFQMICFSLVVGASIIGVGTQINDLTSFEVPQALLGILGLSQVVYVAGKLVAPPSISDLDAQITKLQDLEKKLRELNDTANSTLAGTNVVTWTVDKTLAEAQKTYADYLEIWERTKTMFQTTLGRLVPETAQGKRPPFVISDVVLSKLKDGKPNEAYEQTLILTGMPGPAPYVWSVDGGTTPLHTTLDAAANTIDAILKIPAADALLGEYRFTLRVRGATADQTITRDFLLRIR
jgi:hypothetical protein